MIPGQTDLVATLASIDDALVTYDIYRAFGFSKFMSVKYAAQSHPGVLDREVWAALAERSRSSSPALSPSLAAPAEVVG